MLVLFDVLTPIFSYASLRRKFAVAAPVRLTPVSALLRTLIHLDVVAEVRLIVITHLDVDVVAKVRLVVSLVIRLAFTFHNFDHAILDSTCIGKRVVARYLLLGRGIDLILSFVFELMTIGNSFIASIPVR